MFENRSSLSLHRHPFTDNRWYDIRFDIEECIVAIDGNWTAHVNKVILDFSGYRREFDSSTFFEVHRKHHSKYTPDIDVRNEALIGIPNGLIAVWEKGGIERAQYSDDLVCWQNISIPKAKDLLNNPSIETSNTQSLCSNINKHCSKHSISHADSVSQLYSGSHRIIDQYIREHSNDWQITRVAPGFKVVEHYGSVLFTITPLDIVFWKEIGSPETISEHEAIAQMRSLSLYGAKDTFR